jgi:hypothetical protein
MKTAYLYRNTSTKAGTFGIFAVPEVSWCCFSLEPPWENNTPFDSCIPAGEYVCYFTKSPRFDRRLYQVFEVTGITGIRIHPFNFVSETDGCIGLGEKICYINGKKCLVDPRSTIRKLHEIMAGERFKLEIKWTVL